MLISNFCNLFSGWNFFWHLPGQDTFPSEFNTKKKVFLATQFEPLVIIACTVGAPVWFFVSCRFQLRTWLVRAGCSKGRMGWVCERPLASPSRASLSLSRPLVERRLLSLSPLSLYRLLYYFFLLLRPLVPICTYSPQTLAERWLLLARYPGGKKPRAHATQAIVITAPPPPPPPHLQSSFAVPVLASKKQRKILIP